MQTVVSRLFTYADVESDNRAARALGGVGQWRGDKTTVQFLAQQEMTMGKTEFRALMRQTFADLLHNVGEDLFGKQRPSDRITDAYCASLRKRLNNAQSKFVDEPKDALDSLAYGKFRQNLQSKYADEIVARNLPYSTIMQDYVDSARERHASAAPAPKQSASDADKARQMLATDKLYALKAGLTDDDILSALGYQHLTTHAVANAA